MKNSNDFWQALKASFVSKKARIVWKVIVWVIKLGLIIFKLLELIDKHSKP